jgi:hypothetical protein
MTQGGGDGRDDELGRRLRDVLHDRGLAVTPAADAMERVHVGARRRQQRRLVASSAAAFILVAALGIGVAASGGGDPGHHAVAATSPSPPSEPTAAASSPAVAPSASVGPSEPPSPSPSVQLPPASAPNSAIGASSFEPLSVTAVGVDNFWVLGSTVTPYAGYANSETTIVRTTDGGRHFTVVSHPAWFLARLPISVPPGTPLVSDIRFGDANNGWADGSAFYQTSDGGVSWSQVAGVPGDVVDVVAANGTAWAVVDLTHAATPPPAGSQYALYSTPYGHGRQQWTRVTLPIDLGATEPSIVDQDGIVTLLASGPTRQGDLDHVLIAQPGRPFADHAGPCFQELGGELSNSVSAIWAVCPTGNLAGLAVSTDRGATWRGVPDLPPPSFPDPGNGALGAVDGHHAVVYDLATSGLLRVTAGGPPVNVGSNLTPTLATSFVGFTDTAHGFAVVDVEQVKPTLSATQLWRTEDGGLHWWALDFDS